MAHEIKIRLVERRIDTHSQSLLFGFTEGLGSALAYAVVIFATIYVLQDIVGDEPADAPTEQASE